MITCPLVPMQIPKAAIPMVDIVQPPERVVLPQGGRRKPPAALSRSEVVTEASQNCFEVAPPQFAAAAAWIQSLGMDDST